MSFRTAPHWNAIGLPKAAQQVNSFHKATDLAIYLKSRGWRAAYYNSETDDEGDREENSTTLRHVRTTGSYQPYKPEWKVPIDEQWLDYGIHSKRYDEKTNERIKKEDFGFVNANNGTHTALLMNGAVYEVHWNKEGFDEYPIDMPDKEKLYEKTDFNKWNQNRGEKKKQGVVMLPPLAK